MRGGHQRRQLYAGLLCIALALYTIANLFYSTLSSVTKQDAAGAADSPHLFLFAQHHCPTPPLLPAGEKYMLYSPHSGFSNQVGELKNALLVAALLNRTLVLPPIFDHHAVALGSCPKFRVHEPHQMRALAWAHISDLIHHGRYLAMADVLDLSSVASLVKLVDLRIFSLLWCGVDIASACSGSLCRRVAAHASTWGTLEGCGALLSKPDEAHGSCVYGVNDDCRTTIWVHGVTRSGSSQMSGSISPPQELAVNEDLSNKNTKKKYGRKSFKDIVEALGNGSEAGKYQVLAFGSLFSSEYKGVQLHVDIESSKDPKVRTLLEAMRFFPFTPSIVNAGKVYAKKMIGQPFFCAQLRLLDGQFKNHWEKTFASLRVQLMDLQDKQGLSQVLHVFVMTDLLRSNWSKTYLGELDANKSLYKLHTLDGDDPLIQKTAFSLAKDDYGLKSGFLPRLNKTTSTDKQDHVAIVSHPDILLFVEEVICSCATLGFAGTSGSTLSENIVQLRMGNICNVNS